MRKLLLLLLSILLLLACSSKPTSEDATKFINDANQMLLRLSSEGNRALWVSENFITEDTQAINARANQAYIEALARFAKDATRFDSVKVPAPIRRQLNLLKLSLVMAPPSDPKASEELTTVAAHLDAAYGKGKWCEDPAKPETCLDIDKITNIMAESRDEKRLRQVWEGWHTISPPMKKDYVRLVELSNKGARELGFADAGAMWRSKYDMPDGDYTKELEQLWAQTRPLYIKLHAYVRSRLREKYGDVVSADGPLPAHLLGDIWAQDWSNIYPLVKPPNEDKGYDLKAILKARNTTATDMVRMAERFYVSLGFSPLPQTFWSRSLFAKPVDHDVVCHASAWDIDNDEDLRIKMCIQPREDDFKTVHHELGHDYYFRAYKNLPYLFRDSANDGVHEAVGDTIALSVTPEYLVKVGLLPGLPRNSGDTGLLLSKALEKIAFLPFAIMIDEWRWKVFSSQIKPEDYNKAWWELRLKYQGIAPLSPRGEEFFDPGAKYHVPGNVPYARYFMAVFFQFQFHQALSKTSGCTAPLIHCSIYGNKAAGERLNKMLALGLSQPWPDTIETLTGSRQMDAAPLMEYFAPLDRWLDEQIKGKPIGW